MAREMGCKTGGAMTGGALTEKAIETVRYIAQKTEHNYPIIGSGGMMEPEDVRRMLEAGASLVALNSGLRTNGLRLLTASANILGKIANTQTTTK